MSYTFYTSSNSGLYSGIGFFVKVPTAPASDMTLVDSNWGASGYFRTKLTSLLKVYAELSYYGTVQAPELTAGTPLVTGAWYWVEFGFIMGYPPDNKFQIAGQVWGPGGVSPGQQTPAYFYHTGANESNTLTGQLGIGVSVSTSYLNFPNSAGWEMSKLRQYHRTGTSGGLLGPPTADPTGNDLNFNARQPVGAGTSLTDSSGNAQIAVAGSQGLTINADGPFGS